jgi:glycosyltransferase involved in cell wall biosynthesis
LSRIFINGYNSVIGGGKLIFDNFLDEISKNNDSNKYFILVRNYDEYSRFESSNIKIIHINNVFSINILFPLLYVMVIQYHIFKYDIDYIFNLGDVIIPFRRKQVYFFDWAYAIDDSEFIWSNMPVNEKLIRLTKKYLIKIFIQKISCIYCQTEYMRESLIMKFGVKPNKVVAFHTPIALTFINNNLLKRVNKTDKKRIFYPASFTNHKNFNYIIELGKLIDINKIQVQIVLTIEKNSSKVFWSKIQEYNIKSIITLGNLSPSAVAIELYNSDALFFPSLLESYGLPLIESMALMKPILVSNLPYSRTLCKNNAFYFDPFEPQSGLLAIENFISNENLVFEKVNNAYNDFIKYPSWHDFYFSIKNNFN